MNKGWLILLITSLAIFAGIKVTQFKKSAENIYDKLKLSKGNVSMSLDINIINISNVHIPVKNIMVQVQFLKNQIYKDLAYTKTAIKELVIQANTTSTIKDIALEVNAGILSVIDEND